MNAADIRDLILDREEGYETDALDIAIAAARVHIDDLTEEGRTIEEYLTELKGPRNAHYIAVRHALVVLARAYDEEDN